MKLIFVWLMKRGSDLGKQSVLETKSNDNQEESKLLKLRK